MIAIPTRHALGVACALVAGVAGAAAPLYGQTPPARAPEAEERTAPALPASSAPRATTQHALSLAQGALAYTATAETIAVPDAKGEVGANIFVVSYAAAGDAAARRPVSFIFNGGPGAASAFLHLGAIGPRALVTEADGTFGRPPAQLEDNPATWLAFTDLVFIDPVGTGYSQGRGKDENPDQRFWSVRADVRTLDEVIRLWLTRNDRWSSPKFLVGESYGGFRAAFMARALARDVGVAVNGIVMVSPVLDFATIAEDDSEVMPWALRLPSLAAAARAQGRAGDRALPPQGQSEIEHYALGDYLIGIAALDGPSADLVATVARLTGLPEDLIRRHRARLPMRVFAKELLRDRGRVLSLYDGSVSAPDDDPARSGPSLDPVLDGSVAAYATAFGEYVRQELGYRTDQPYQVLNREVSGAWNYEGARPGGQGYADAIEALQGAMALNPSLHVMIVHGRYDLVTPYLGTRWLIDHMTLPAELRANVELKVYDAGHMVYLRPRDRAALAHDAAAMMAAVIGAPS